MKEQIDNCRLLVYRYWVHKGRLLGCAVHWYLLLGALVQLVVMVLALVFLFGNHVLGDHRTVVALLFLLEAFLGAIVSHRWSRYTGIYEVDAAGRPHAFVSHALLPGLRLRNSMGRKRFLKYVQQQQGAALDWR